MNDIYEIGVLEGGEVGGIDYLLKEYNIPFLKAENKAIIKIYHPKEDELTYYIRK